MKKLYLLTFLIILAAGINTLRGVNPGQSKPDSVVGTFDYYLLSLSWSPTYCLTHSEDAQCSGKGYGFVLHGLWPQYALGGWPQSCAPQQKLSREERAKGLMVFPTAKLLNHEWAKHGTCSGLGAAGYLAAADRALAAVKIPESLRPFEQSTYLSAQEIAQLFRRSNPGIAANGIAVICKGPELSEVRVCLSKDMSFAACGKGVKNQCRSGDIRVPPVR